MSKVVDFEANVRLALAMTTASVRMLRRDRGDLHGYVFADLDHARAWLRQAFVERGDIRLECVEVGEFKMCPRCHGVGYTQPIKTLNKDALSVDEFMATGGPQ